MTPRRVWEPIQIGSLRLKNRLFMPPHGLMYGEDGLPSERLFSYYRERARGGAALFTVNTTSATRRTRGGLNFMTAWEMRAIPAFAQLAESIQEHDAKLVVELAAAGVNDSGRALIDDWHPVYGMSRVPSPIRNETPLAMDRALLGELVADFAKSARNMQTAGVDGVELHAAHGYLFMQALSPAFNKRGDEYGGDPAGRCRLLIETASAIRDRVGGDYPLGLRYTFDELIGTGGITEELSEEYLEILADTGLFDYFSISCGGYNALHYSVAPMGTVEEGFMLPFAARAKRVLGDRAPVMAVGRIKSLEAAERALADGAADVVGIMRSQIADPHLLAKSREGRADEVNHCVGANECIGAAFWNRPVTCTVNPVAGRERQWGHGTLRPVESPRQVLVLGGGPAGMRAAGTAASRGHAVTLLERASELGGHLALLRELPGRKDWGLAIETLERRLERYGVEIRTGVEATSETVLAAEADAVVLATGAAWEKSGFSAFRPERDSIPGVEQGNVLDVETAAHRLLEAGTALGERVVFLDDSGSQLPLAVAELAARNGAGVVVLSRLSVVGQEVWENFEAPFVFARLEAGGVRMQAQRFVERIVGRTVDTYSIWGSDEEALEEVDSVVLSLLRRPREELAEAVAAAGVEMHRIGDALAPRKTAEAIYEGEKLGRLL